MKIHVNIINKIITVTINDKTIDIRRLVSLALESYQNQPYEKSNIQDNYIVCSSKSKHVLNNSDIVEYVCKDDDLLEVYFNTESIGINENLLDGETPKNNRFDSPKFGPLESFQSVMVEEVASMNDVSLNLKEKSYHDSLINDINGINIDIKKIIPTDELENTISINDFLNHLTLKCSITKGINGYGLKICDRDILFDGVTTNKFIIKSIEHNSPADHSCIENGDIIIEINDLVVVGIPIDALTKIITQTKKSLQLLVQRKLNTKKDLNPHNSNETKHNFDDSCNDDNRNITNSITVNFFINSSNNQPIILINSLNVKTNFNTNAYSNCQVVMINSFSLYDISVSTCLKIIDSNKTQPVDLIVSRQIKNLKSNDILKFIHKMTFMNLKSIEYSDFPSLIITNKELEYSKNSQRTRLPETIVLSKSYDYHMSKYSNDRTDSDNESYDKSKNESLESESNFNRNVCNRTSFSSKRLSYIQGSSTSKNSTNNDSQKQFSNWSKSGHNRLINSYNQHMNNNKDESSKENDSQNISIKSKSADVEQSSMKIIGKTTRNNISFHLNKYSNVISSSPTSSQQKQKNTSWLSKLFKRKSTLDKPNVNSFNLSMSSQIPFNEFSVDIKTPPSNTSSSKKDNSCDIENGPIHVNKFDLVNLEQKSLNKQNEQNDLNMNKLNQNNPDKPKAIPINFFNAINHNRAQLTRTTSQVTYITSTKNNLKPIKPPKKSLSLKNSNSNIKSLV